MNLEEIRDWFCGAETRASFDDIVRIKQLIEKCEKAEIRFKQQREAWEAESAWWKEKVEKRVKRIKELEEGLREAVDLIEAEAHRPEIVRKIQLRLDGKKLPKFKDIIGLFVDEEEKPSG